MLKFSKNDLNEISNHINSKTPSSFPVYLTGLLFACAMHCIWLIIVFSILCGINLLIALNKKFKIIEITTK